MQIILQFFYVFDILVHFNEVLCTVYTIHGLDIKFYLI